MKIEDDISSLSVLYLFLQNSLTLLKVEEQCGHLQMLPTTDDDCMSYSIGRDSNTVISTFIIIIVIIVILRIIPCPWVYNQSGI